MSLSHDSDLKLDRAIFWHEIYVYLLESVPAGQSWNATLAVGLRETWRAVVSVTLKTVLSDVRVSLFQLHLQWELSFFLREVAFLVVCPFRCSSSSSCCQIHWIVTQLLHLLCCYMTAFIGTKSPIGLKWSVFLNGRSNGSSRRYLPRIPLEERGRASMPVHITLHTDTPPKGTEEISQLSLKMAVLVEDPSIWFCKGLTRPLSFSRYSF